MSGGEKTEEPTEQKKKQARSEGQIPRTPDFATWGGLLVASILLPMVVESMIRRLRGMMAAIATLIEDPSNDKIVALLQEGLRDFVIIVAPLCGGLFLFSLATFTVQGGIKPATKLFIPKFSRLSPLAGFKRILGPTALWETFKVIAKSVIIGLVIYNAISALVPGIMTSGLIPLPTLLSTVGDTAINMIRSAAAAGLVLAATDYAMVRRRIGKQIKMTKQEVKEEHRRSEGDPQIKSAIRQRQFAMSRQRMMAELPKADVVLVNPSQVAVALRYDPARGAPRVIAKGSGTLAAKIREKATELRLPMVRDRALARALYDSCDLDDEIPANFYEAVARVLAFIMVLKSKGSAAGLHTPPS